MDVRTFSAQHRLIVEQVRECLCRDEPDFSIAQGAGSEVVPPGNNLLRRQLFAKNIDTVSAIARRQLPTGESLVKINSFVYS